MNIEHPTSNIEHRSGRGEELEVICYWGRGGGKRVAGLKVEGQRPEFNEVAVSLSGVGAAGPHRPTVRLGSG